MDKKIIISIIAVVILVVVGGGLWYVKSQKKHTILLNNFKPVTLQTAQNSNGIIRPIETKTTPIVADSGEENILKQVGMEKNGWRIYQSAKYDFEVALPEYWTYKITQKSEHGSDKVHFFNNNNLVLSIYTPIPEIGFELWYSTDTKIIPTNDKETNLRYEYLKADGSMFSEEARASVQNGDEDVVHVKWLRGSNDGIVDNWKGDWSETGLIIYELPKDLKILNSILKTFKFTK